MKRSETLCLLQIYDIHYRELSHYQHRILGWRQKTISLYGEHLTLRPYPSFYTFGRYICLFLGLLA